MINIKFSKNKPEFYGFTGVHLYAANPEDINAEQNILIGENAKAINLYKLYNDILIFLSNKVEPSPGENNVKTYPVFGNPKHMKFIKNEMSAYEEHQIVGYLDNEDVREVRQFLNSNSLDKKENVQTYFDSLDKEVKEELEMLLDDRIVWELHGYLEPMVKFFDDCNETKSTVVIIANA